MADDNDPQGSAWPLPKFHFLVQLGNDMDVKFAEVTGLEETTVVEYRRSDSPLFSSIKMPGLRKAGNVTMRKGTFANDPKFWKWLSDVRMNVISPRTVVVNLLDETGTPTMVWTLQKAWPTRITGTDLKSGSGEVAVDTLELAFETLEIKAG